MQYSWVPYCGVNKDISLLNFRKSVMQYYLKAYRSLPNHPHNRFFAKESSIDCSVSDYNRLNGYINFIQVTFRDHNRRCAGAGCSSRVRTKCKNAIWVTASPALPLFTNSNTVIYFPNQLEYRRTLSNFISLTM